MDHPITSRLAGQKKQIFTAGTYKITTISDDGIRVYIDGTPVINQWNDHSTATFEATLAIPAGEHTIRVEYYENYVDAIAKVIIVKL